MSKYTQTPVKKACSDSCHEIGKDGRIESAIVFDDDAMESAGDKTNNVPPNMNSPSPQMQQGGVFLTGFTGLTGLPGIGNLVNLVNPVQTTPLQQTIAERKAANWNIRGA